MSNLGKIFLWIALVGAIAAGVAGFLLMQAHDTVKQNLADSQQKEAAEEKALVTAKTQLTDAQAAQKAAEQKATDDDSKITDLNNQLTTAQSDAANAKAALGKAQDDTKAAQAKVDQMTSDLGGKTVQQYKDDVAAAQKDRDDAVAQQKILQDSLQQANQKVADMVDAINRSKTATNKPGVSGKVTFVDRTWNFVVLDVGLDAGVVPNGELIVYRNNKFLGKVRVTRADPGDSVAEILPDLKGNIQVGDAVLN